VHLVTKVNLLLTGNPGVADVICDGGPSLTDNFVKKFAQRPM
jgi:hypothetical protein